MPRWPFVVSKQQRQHLRAKIWRRVSVCTMPLRWPQLLGSCAVTSVMAPWLYWNGGCPQSITFRGPRIACGIVTRDCASGYSKDKMTEPASFPSAEISSFCARGWSDGWWWCLAIDVAKKGVQGCEGKCPCLLSKWGKAEGLSLQVLQHVELFKYEMIEINHIPINNPHSCQLGFPSPSSHDSEFQE